uniref:Uncharacterized protein n=1 Tax=Quercus lobata TaxID=97700 RepID=A0A7N2LQ75_QUELO
MHLPISCKEWCPQQHFVVFSSGIRSNNRIFHRKSSFISMSSRSPTTIQHLHNTMSSSSNHNLDIPIMFWMLLNDSSSL